MIERHEILLSSLTIIDKYFKRLLRLPGKLPFVSPIFQLLCQILFHVFVAGQSIFTVVTKQFRDNISRGRCFHQPFLVLVFNLVYSIVAKMYVKHLYSFCKSGKNKVNIYFKCPKYFELYVSLQGRIQGTTLKVLFIYKWFFSIVCKPVVFIY